MAAPTFWLERVFRLRSRLSVLQCSTLPWIPEGRVIIDVGGNALWASTKSGPVAPTKNKLEELINWQFAAPDVVFPETIIIGVFPTTKGPKPTDVSARGSLIRLSPEEPLHAWITVAAESIRNNEGPEQLASWVDMVMAAPLEFRRIPGQKAVFWAQVSERESLGRRFSAMFRVPKTQTCFASVVCGYFFGPLY